MIKIIADTTSVLPLDLCEKLGIVLMPQLIVFGEKTFRDDKELSAEQFLSMLKTSKEAPKTAAPPPELYQPVYKELINQNDTVLVICPSSDVSGTYRSATVAAQDFPEASIHIIDTRLIAGGLASLILKTHQWIQEGHDIDSILENIHLRSLKEKMYFTPETLEYLARGGRIGNAEAILGGLLQIKPVLTMIDGKNEVQEKQRTQKRAISRMIELTLQDCPHSEDAQLCVVQSDAPEKAATIAQKLSQATGIKNIPIYQQCASIVTHVGPGVLSISYYR